MRLLCVNQSGINLGFYMLMPYLAAYLIGDLGLAAALAGALFNPAVRAYLAQRSGDRRVESFAVVNVFYQAGILAGSIVGLALVVVDFRFACAAAAAPVVLRGRGGMW